MLERVRALQATGRLPSVVVGELRRGELAETHAVGAAPGTPYRIGSITKTLTAVLVMQCRDEGLLALDDPLGRFVPESGYADARVGDLLAHASGMQSEPAGEWWERSAGVGFASLNAANDGSGAVSGPGEFFHYSNLGYALLGEAVARLRGGSWWSLVQERLLAPLGMTSTTYDPPGDAAAGLSVEHLTGRLMFEPHTDTGAMAPAGQLWSTVGDLATWARFLTAGHPEVLAVETLREMGEPRLDPGYGLGLSILAQRGRRLVGHTGSMPGFMASLFVDPVDGDGVVLLTNATTGLVTVQVPALLLGDDDPTPADPWVPTIEVPALVGPLLGTWFWGNTAFELRWQNHTLQTRNLSTGRLTDVFVLDGDRIVGSAGYHRGETLHVHPTHLECATFVYTRVPYDPAAPIPGG